MKIAVKRTLSFIMVMTLIIISLFNVSAKSQKLKVTENGITWTLYDNGELVVSGKGEIKKLPSELDEKDEEMYRGLYDVKSLQIEEGITSIAEEIFYDAKNLEKAEIADSVTYIGKCAFEECRKLKYVKLPKGLKAISGGIFDDCRALEKVTMPDSYTEIESYAFHRCHKIEEIYMPETLTKIGYYAFSECFMLSGIELPEGLTDIEAGAFWCCGSIKKLSIPCGVKALRNNTFVGCEFEYIIISNPKCEIEKTIKLREGVLFGYKNSTAEEYAKNAGLKFYPLDKGSTEHYYTSSEVTKQPTCKADGEKISKCPCGYTKVEKIAKTNGHTYKMYTTAATTKKNGATTVKCSGCGVIKSQTAIKKIASVKLSKTTLKYNGKAQKPTVTVKNSNGTKLKEGRDYTVKYSKGCKYVGQYTVTITFKGNYAGTKTLTFKIVPKGTSISKLTAGKKQFTAKWSAQTAQTTGYELQYSTKSSMSGAKTVTVKKNKTTSAKVKKLKGKKKYYARVRTYKLVKINGKNVKLYSSWSKVKSVKTK